ncbi:MAG TPA: hypothetical protein VHV27_11560 [Phenylobacterium sp.]|jgi:hypothetical protein|nr:hypothetical protein [Phenylobacterium sp.]
MMMPASHLETALKRVQRIVATASLPSPPITAREALEYVTEELDLAGYGDPEVGEPESELVS